MTKGVKYSCKYRDKDVWLICSYSALFQLHAAVAETEQEKFELQKKHTENIQELLEDTNLRLAKMEAEYNARSQATVSNSRVCVCVCVASSGNSLNVS